MKKVWFGLAAIVVSGSLTFGNTAGVPQVYAENTAVSSEVVPRLTPKRPQKRTHEDVILAQEPPRPAVEQTAPQTALIDVMPPVPVPMPEAIPVQMPVQMPAQRASVPAVAPQPAIPPAPVLVAVNPAPAAVFAPAAPAAGGTDPHIYSELERISEELQKLKKDTAKPDTKKAFSTPKLGGRVFFDSYTMDQSPNQNALGLNDPGNYVQNKAGIRELRVAMSGSGFDSFDYKAEIGVAGTGTVNVYDTWIGAKNVPLFGYFRVGHYRPETGLDYMTSGLHNTLTETLTPTTAFNLGRKLGVSSEHLFARDRIRFFYGLFQGGNINVNRSIQADDQGPIFNTRLTAAPYYGEKGKYVLHVGGHYSYVSAASATGVKTAANTGGISAVIGGNNWLNQTLTTGVIASNHHHRGGIELAYQSGPFAVRSEGLFVQYGESDNDRCATGASVELTYFLTGDYREYNLAGGNFGGAKVKKPFHPFQCGDWNLVDGMGAWQFVTQYSYLDLGDWREVGGGTAWGYTGGLQHDLTFGVNWFWTSNLRWIFEYTRSQQNYGVNFAHRHQDIFGSSVHIHW